MSLMMMTPREIVCELEKHIIGQEAAKRAVAIALRNRYRRMQVELPLRTEITPKNILMIGPTGVGKTEIARRLARLANAPFVKVEATKFTEVGYVGREVDSIIKDLADIAVKDMREAEMARMTVKAKAAATERLLDHFVPHSGEDEAPSPARASFAEKLAAGTLDDEEIEIELNAPRMGVEIMGPPGMEDMTQQLQGMFKQMGTEKKQKRKLSVQEALKALTEEEAEKLVNEEEIRLQAIEHLEQHGIVFLDELDKVATRQQQGGEVSREGVQRDLLPLVEGTTVATKYGMVKTDHILFIASGAFHLARPSDLIPELQGRLTIRVELNALRTKDFVQILTKTDACLTKQYSALMATEGLALSFTKEAVERLAEIAWQINERSENIGARRLHTVMERLLEQVSFEACDQSEKTLTIDEDYVNKQLTDVIQDDDLSQFIL